jgi:hypothetical protein
MIFVDLSGILFASLHVDIKQGGQPTEEYIRSLTLNTLRIYNKDFRRKYGEMVITFDSTSWRDLEFEYYKWVRRADRESEESDIDWGVVWEIFSKIQLELTRFMPYRTMAAVGAEADDSIGVMCRYADEPTLIISNDKDLVELTKFEFVDHYRPYAKEMFVVEDPLRFCFDLIISGDKTDGIPSIKNPADFYVTQWKAKKAGEKHPPAKPVSKKWKDELWIAYNTDPQTFVAALGEFKDRYAQNTKLVSLDYIPEDVVDRIKEAWFNTSNNSEATMIKYFRENRLQLLSKYIADFRLHKLERTLF